MPIYEYECKDCGAVFERLQPSRAKKKGEPCEQCEGTNTERLLSAFAARGGTGGDSDAMPPCPSAASCPNASCQMKR